MVVVVSLHVLSKEAALNVGISSSTDESFIREWTLISCLGELLQILCESGQSDLFQFVGNVDQHRLVLRKSKSINLAVFTESFKDELMIQLNISQVETCIRVDS